MATVRHERTTVIDIARRHMDQQRAATSTAPAAAPEADHAKRILRALISTDQYADEPLRELEWIADLIQRYSRKNGLLYELGRKLGRLAGEIEAVPGLAGLAASVAGQAEDAREAIVAASEYVAGVDDGGSEEAYKHLEAAVDELNNMISHVRDAEEAHTVEDVEDLDSFEDAVQAAKERAAAAEESKE